MVSMILYDSLEKPSCLSGIICCVHLGCYLGLIVLTRTVSKYQTKLNTKGRRKHSSLVVRCRWCSICCMYNKTFYVHNCCRIEISQSACHFHSLSPQSNNCRQDWSLSEWSPLQDNTLKLGSLPCPQILDQGGIEWQRQTLQLITIR